MNPAQSPALERIIRTLALAISVALCLPLVVAMGALLTIGSGPVRSEAPVAFHTPLLVAMLGGPPLAVALSGAVFVWQSRAKQRATLAQELATSGSGWTPLSGLVMGVVIATFVLLLLAFLIHVIAG
jgi:hypothetical protein